MDIAILRTVHCWLDRGKGPSWVRWLIQQGYMGTPYLELLSSELEKSGWSLCQLHMRSSYLGFGTGSLDRDSEDISNCISYLYKSGKSHVVLMGHSTGSQNSIHYILNRLRRTRDAPAVCGAIVL